MASFPVQTLNRLPNLNRPFSESADQNKIVITEVLQQHFVNDGTVLEIGAGKGQHARHFSSSLPHLQWTPTEVPHYIAMLEQGVVDSGLTNLASALALDVNVPNSSDSTLLTSYDYIFTANTLHIMSWQSCIHLISLAANLLTAEGLMATYGPYNVDGKFTSDSNARFEQWLTQRDPKSGIRDIADLRREGLEQGLEIVNIIEMPVNNKLLIWRKV